MNIVGSPGAVTVTNNPQIVAGADKDRLTIRGTSNTNTVKFSNGTGLSLAGGLAAVLAEGDTLGLVYNYSTSVWTETSRNKGGL